MKKILVQNHIENETRDCPDPGKCFIYLFTSGGNFISRGPDSLDFQGEYLVVRGAVANGSLKLQKMVVSYDHIAGVAVHPGT